MFEKAHDFNIDHGTFNKVDGNQYNTTTNNFFTALESLYNAASKGAAFDSAEQEHASHCLSGTREEVLNQIIRWIDDPNASSMLWLHGYAGTGKSTIARTVAEIASKKGVLAGSFFFSGDVDDRKKSKHVFPTLAHQLSISIPPLKQQLIQILNEDTSIPDKSLRFQFPKLMKEPFLRHAAAVSQNASHLDSLADSSASYFDGRGIRGVDKLRPSMDAWQDFRTRTNQVGKKMGITPLLTPFGPSGISTDVADFPPLRSPATTLNSPNTPAPSLPVAGSNHSLLEKNVVILDSIHECDNEADVREMVQLIAQALKASELPLRFILTSRSEDYISSMFDNLDVKPLTLLRLSLDDFDPRNDIRTFYEYYLHGIPRNIDPVLSQVVPWPSKNHMEQLTDKSTPSWIYTAAVVNFIKDKRARPSRQLEIVLGIEYIPNATIFARLDKLYRCIFKAAGMDIEPTRLVIACTLLLFDPLSMGQLERLLKLEAGDVSRSMQGLHSLFVIPKEPERPIRIFHTTVREFLTNRERSQEAFIDPVIYQQEIASYCFQLMFDKLREDICQLGYPCKSNREMSDLAERCETAVGGALRYVCRFWAVHLSKSSLDRLASDLEKFFVRSWKHWVEVLSLCGNMDDALVSIRTARTIVKSSSERHDSILTALDDAEGLISKYMTEISASALFIYHIPSPDKIANESPKSTADAGNVEFQHLRDELAACKAQMKKDEETIAHLRKEIFDIEEAYRETVEEMEMEISKVVKKTRGERDRARWELDNARGEVQAYRQNLSDTKEVVDQLSQQIVVLQADLTSARSHLNSL